MLALARGSSPLWRVHSPTVNCRLPIQESDKEQEIYKNPADPNKIDPRDQDFYFIFYFYFFGSDDWVYR